MRTHPFTRPTITAAVEFLDIALSTASFDQLLVRLELDGDIALGAAKSVKAKSAMLAHIINQRAENVIRTLNGPVTLAEAIVREAVEATIPFSEKVQQDRLIRGLALDGFVVTWSNDPLRPLLRAALPGEVELPATDDEVHQLLKLFGFTLPLGHLDQAIDAHTRGDWAAANSQVRTFLESLFDSIAIHIDPQTAALSTSENRRKFLGDRSFLSTARNEWSDDGKNYVNGLFKMLHTEGSHPGLSDEDRSTFRLHLALITGRTFLRRLNNGS